MTIFDLCHMLSNRLVTGHEAISLILGFINKFNEHKDTILRVLDKDLGCRIDAKTINKVIPNLIPTFDVSLGEKVEWDRFNWQEDKWYISRKLDGIRCVYQANYHTTTSRQGEEFWVLDVLKDALKSCSDVLEGYVLDGELSLITDDGSDDFQGIMKQIRRKNHTIQQIRYNVFDMLTQEEFDSKTSTRTFSERYAQLQAVKEKLEATGHIKVVDQVLMDSEETLQNLRQAVIDNGWEGLMLRKDCEYKGKRSYDLMKVKNFSDAEYVVESVEYGVKPMLIDGLMKDVECVAALHFSHKGFDVKCGSGMNDSQRVEWKEDPSKIIGKTIKVKYFEETTDQNGNISLRFPILLNVYENGRFD
jgi:DNA ligase-1